MTTKLDHFPIGTRFHYLGVPLVVIDLIRSPGGFELSQPRDVLLCHYVDGGGRIRTVHFEEKAFEYLQAIIADQAARQGCAGGIAWVRHE
jgi:hypothetical protein